MTEKQLLCPECGRELHPSKWGPAMVCSEGHGYANGVADNMPPNVTKKVKTQSPPTK